MIIDIHLNLKLLVQNQVKNKKYSNFLPQLDKIVNCIIFFLFLFNLLQLKLLINIQFYLYFFFRRKSSTFKFLNCNLSRFHRAFNKAK